MGMIAYSTNARAQGGPPMITDDPGTPGTGHWENNFAFTLDNTPTEHLYETPIADINYGWGPNIQLKLELPLVVVKTPNASAVTGLANANLGVKIRFLDEDSSGINFSTYPQYRLNYTGVSTILFGNQFFLPLEAMRTFGNLELDGEVGYDFLKAQPGEWEYGVVAGYNTSESFEMLVELHATSATNMATELIANVGGKYKLADAFNLLGSVGRNLTPAGYNEYLAFVGLQWLVQ